MGSVGQGRGGWSHLGAVRLTCRDFETVVTQTRPELAARLASSLARRFLRRPWDTPSASLVRWLNRAQSLDLTLSLLVGDRPQHDGLNALLQHAPRVRQLKLCGYRSSNIDATLLELEWVPLLESLQVQRIQPGPSGWFGLNLQGLPKLRELTLADTGPARDQRSQAFTAPAHLEVLSLTDAGLAPNDVAALELHKLTNLRVLQLDGLALHDEGFLQLTKLALPKLEELRLPHTRLTGRAFRGPSLNLFPSLRVLDLTGNLLGDEGADTLDFSTVPQLRGLNLSNNRLGNEGLIRLRGRLPKQLDWLEVGQNGISPAVARFHDVYTWPNGVMAWRRDQLFAPEAEPAHWLWRWLRQVFTGISMDLPTAL